jgi:hypothetical protein
MGKRSCIWVEYRRAVGHLSLPKKEGAPGGGSLEIGSDPRLLHGADVRRLLALGPVDDVELHLLALV